MLGTTIISYSRVGVAELHVMMTTSHTNKEQTAPGRESSERGISPFLRTYFRGYERAVVHPSKSLWNSWMSWLGRPG